MRAAAPRSAPARMPGMYAQRLYARTHTSGRTKSVQDAPTTNDHDCRDAEPTKHTQLFTGERGVRQGCRNKDTPSFKHGCLQVVEQSRCRTHRQQTTTIAQMQSQPSIHSLSRGKGVFGKDAEIRTHQALHEAKPIECPKGDRDNKSEVYFKNILFLQTERPP